MGNWFSQSEEEIIESIVWSKKFWKYSRYFEEMDNRHDIYVEDGNLVIEASNYIDIISPNWHESDVEQFIYNYLDKVYKSKTGKDINDINTFIKVSVNTTLEHWEDWLEVYFSHKSPGYYKFKNMGDSECYYDNNYPIYSKQLIWYTTLQDLVDDGYLLVNTSDDNQVQLTDEFGNCLVVLTNKNESWKYTDVPDSCLESIQSIYNYQFD